MRLARWLATWWGSLWRPRAKEPKPHFTRLRRIESLSDAGALASDEIALVADGPRLKWAVLICPCGCGERIHVNLMRTQHPSWSIEFGEDEKVTFRPSLWRGAATCGSHFILQHGQVHWCRAET
jgi:hypothetical protein